MSPQPWLRSMSADLCFIIAPPLVASAMVLAAPILFARIEGTPPWAWLLLVLGIDVAHVYGTLFRTYFDRKERKRYRGLLIGIPLIGWLSGALLYSIGELTFWRVLAYLAVFHFIRQQYGFARIYGRKESLASPLDLWNRRLDALAIYSATLYPLIYWHTHLPRKFNWFIDGDFLSLPRSLDKVAFWAFLFIQASFILRELRRLIKSPHSVNVPKDLLILGTAVSWYVGIVIFNGDLEFTLINVVSHGIPYLGLVWFTEQTRHQPKLKRPWWTLPVIGLISFLGVLLVFAYIEEAFWDSLIWRDHPQFFSWIYALPTITTAGLLTWIVPLLALPQITHYILDGFVWKLRDPEVLRNMK